MSGPCIAQTKGGTYWDAMSTAGFYRPEGVLTAAVATHVKTSCATELAAPLQRQDHWRFRIGGDVKFSAHNMNFVRAGQDFPPLVVAATTRPERCAPRQPAEAKRRCLRLVAGVISPVERPVPDHVSRRVGRFRVRRPTRGERFR